jgi:uncharacterized repeat protein (TIGR02543 family)
MYMRKIGIQALLLVLLGALTPSATAADKVGSLSASRNGETGLVSISWTVSTITNLTGYKVVVDAAGDGKLVSQFRTPGSITSAKICFPFTGNTSVLVAPTTSSDTNPTYTNRNSPGGNWQSTPLGALGSVTGTPCTSNSTTTRDYTIRFDSNNAKTTGTMNSITGNDFSVSLPANSFSLTGYTFDGWSTTRTGVGGTSYSNEQIVTLSAALDTTLYAQ